MEHNGAEVIQFPLSQRHCDIAKAFAKSSCDGEATEEAALSGSAIPAEPEAGKTPIPGPRNARGRLATGRGIHSENLGTLPIYYIIYILISQ